MTQEPAASSRERIEQHTAQIRKLVNQIKELNERSSAHFAKFLKGELRVAPKESKPIPLDQ